MCELIPFINFTVIYYYLVANYFGEYFYTMPAQPALLGVFMEYYFIDGSVTKRGGVKNVIRVKEGRISHFQLEKRDGKTYMRFKRRKISQ